MADLNTCGQKIGTRCTPKWPFCTSLICAEARKYVAFSDGGHVEWPHLRSEDYRFLQQNKIFSALKRLFLLMDKKYLFYAISVYTTCRPYSVVDYRSVSLPPFGH